MSPLAHMAHTPSEASIEQFLYARICTKHQEHSMEQEAPGPCPRAAYSLDYGARWTGFKSQFYH